MKDFFSKPLAARNQALVAVVGTAIIVALLLLAVSIRQLPLLSNNVTYHAYIADAAGLETGDDVRIAGVPVGSVSAVSLSGSQVEVTFSVDGSHKLGDQTRVDVLVASILGQVYVDVKPGGSGALSSDEIIPQSRTSVPFTLLEVLGTLTTTTGQIDLPQLTTALATLSDSLRTAPGSVKPLLASLGKLSQTIAARSDKLSSLISSADDVTGALSGEQAQLVTLLTDGDTLLAALNQRRTVVHQLLVDSSSLAQELSTLITKDSAELTPLLADLHSVTDLLVRDQGALDQTVQELSPFSRYVANSTGSGSWIDLLSPTVLLPDNTLVQCAGTTGNCQP